MSNTSLFRSGPQVNKQVGLVWKTSEVHSSLMSVEDADFLGGSDDKALYHQSPFCQQLVFRFKTLLMLRPGLYEDVCDGGPGLCVHFLFPNQGIRIAPAKLPWKDMTKFCLGRASAPI